jgi:hypothetical protein
MMSSTAPPTAAPAIKPIFGPASSSGAGVGPLGATAAADMAPETPSESRVAVGMLMAADCAAALALALLDSKAMFNLIAFGPDEGSAETVMRI